MSLINDKKGIFGDIAALNTLLDRMPKLNKNSSLESASNDKNPMKFLADVLVVLAELNALKNIVVDVITYQLPKLEEDIKEALKETLKENCGCDVNPSIPTFFKSTGSVLSSLKTDSQKYFEYHHSAQDIFTKVNKRELELGSAAMSSLVYLVDTFGL